MPFYYEGSLTNYLQISTNCQKKLETLKIKYLLSKIQMLSTLRLIGALPKISIT